MPDPLTIGALVALAKSIAEAINSLSKSFPETNLFGKPNPAKIELEKLKSNVALFYQRLETLTDQLEKSEFLVRIVEAWLQVVKRLRTPHTLAQVSSTDEERIFDDLRNFLRSTGSDYFSGALFGTDFDQFPAINNTLIGFRSHLHQLEQTVNAITPGNSQVLRGQWPSIVGQLHTLGNSAAELSREASLVHDRLIKELKHAAKGPKA